MIVPETELFPFWVVFFPFWSRDGGRLRGRIRMSLFQRCFFARWLVLNNQRIKRRNYIFDEKEGSE